MACFTLDLDADGVALLTWDMAERSMNVFTLAVLEEFAALVESVTADAAVKGVVITSGKDTFSGGGDLGLLETLSRAFADYARQHGEEAAAVRLLEESSTLSRLIRRIETGGKPWVAALNGTAVGGAFELALGCHHRVAGDNPRTRLGLPEIKVGLFPGAGGTQRIARMLPPADALQVLLEGELLTVARARAMRLIDAVVPATELIGAAKAWIRNGGSAEAPWDTEGFKLPGGPVYSKAGMITFPAANAIYRRETYDNYPAARAVLQVVYEGLQLPMDLALKVESRWFAKTLHSAEAAAMMRTLFGSMQALNKGARRPGAIAPTQVKRLGVVGAGFMGAGIAAAAAGAGMSVVLVDRDAASADAGKAAVQTRVAEQVSRGRIGPAERDALLARIEATADYAALAGCELVVEAVYENEAVKAAAHAAIEAALGCGAIVASNTSGIPIGSLARNFADPARFIGLHFVSPVERMMLVEVIVGPETSEPTLAAGLDFARALRRTPIVVNDSRGFYVSRVVATFIREGHLMLAEGVPPAMIETVARMAGMPVGPLALSDEVALDLAWTILKMTAAALGGETVDPRQRALLGDMVEKRGRYGRKNRKGFYDYPDKGPKHLWPGLADLTDAALDPDAIDIAELKHRFLVAQALETARCFEEKVVTDVREADVGSILGFGFAPFTGGTLSYIDQMGTRRFVELCRALQKTYGARFRPSRLLVEMAASDERFYRRFPPHSRDEAA